MALASRFIQRFGNYSRAFAKLEELVRVLQKDGSDSIFSPSEMELHSEIARQALIKRFEFTQELSWNVLKDYLQNQGETDLAGSRDVFRRALRFGIIADENWMTTIVDRNLSAHDYNDAKSKEISARIIDIYYPLFSELQNKLQSIISLIPPEER